MEAKLNSTGAAWRLAIQMSLMDLSKFGKQFWKQLKVILFTVYVMIAILLVFADDDSDMAFIGITLIVGTDIYMKLKSK